MTVTVYHGDCTAVLPTLAAGSVQCCVTSPPYFGLRAYPHAPTAWPAITFVPVAGLPALTVPAQTGHLGAEADPWVYVAHLVHVFRAVWRVLRDDGTLWLNLGDSYASDSKWGGASGGIQIGRGPEKVPRCQRQTGLGEKQLLMLPFRVVQALQADGWYVRTVIPWIKVNAMPESVRDRPVLGHEYMFVLARSRQYFYDVAAITVPATSTHGSGNGYHRPNRQSYQDRDGTHRGGDRPYTPRPTRSRRTTDWWYDSLNGLFGTADDLLALDVPTRHARQAHVAVYPEQLVAPCILAGTPAPACDQSRTGRSLVLDPFGGSGTTGAVAERLGRDSILIEAAADYLPLITQRTAARLVPRRPPPPPPRPGGPVPEEQTHDS